MRGTLRAERRLAAVDGLARAASRVAWFVEDEVGGVRDVVPVGGNCVDVGAEYGLYTIAMAAAVGPAGTVHAVEPQPDAHRIMDRIVRLSGADRRVVRHHVALGEHAASSTLSVPVRRGRAVHGRAFLTSGAAHGGPNDEEFDSSRSVEVTVSTLDRLCRDLDRLDLLKADVEGAELQVLRGGRGTIERLRPTVQLEIESPHLDKYGATVADVTGFLTDQGYVMHVWAHGGWRRADRVTGDRRNYLFTA